MLIKDLGFRVEYDYSNIERVEGVLNEIFAKED